MGNIKRIIISLFDRRKDYGEVKSQKRGPRRISPSIALAQHQKAMNATRYILLFQKGYKNEANSLIDDIRTALQANRSNADVIPEANISCRSVAYDDNDVWDISVTTRAINDALADLSNEIQEGNVKLYINLENGTAEQKTALALWAYKATHLNQRLTCLFVRKSTHLDTKELQSCDQLDFTNGEDKRHPFGFFQCKIRTSNDSFRKSLAQLEHLLKRISVGMEDVILLTGPSGAGKTMIATMCMKFLQCLNPGISEENCVHINMASIPENLFESELFGHRKGSFTGAIKDKIGLVEQADGGILFMDEIGELPLHLQAKLLTFLDTGKYRRIGEAKERSSKFLLICGTNQSLESITPNRFRRDLYERINMWHFDIPGLHDRPEDIEPTIQRELAIWNDKSKSNIQFAPEAKQKLLNHLKRIPLDGNHRQLHALMRRLATLALGHMITLDDVNREIDPREALMASAGSTSSPDYDYADLALLSVALSACKTAKNGREAGEMLFAATKAKSPTFNGSTYIQRIFKKFGLKVRFKNGKFDSIERD